MSKVPLCKHGIIVGSIHPCEACEIERLAEQIDKLTAENAVLREALDKSAKQADKAIYSNIKHHCDAVVALDGIIQRHKQALSNTNEKAEKMLKVLKDIEQLKLDLSDAREWKVPTELAYTPKGFLWKDCLEQAEVELEEAKEACYDLMCLNDKLTAENAKMLKVVEAATWLYNQFDKPEEGTPEDVLWQAVHEYQEVK